MKHCSVYNSPLGNLYLEEENNFLTKLSYFEKNIDTSSCSGTSGSSATPLSPLLKKAHKQLDEYFKGIRKDFNIPLKTNGTEFQEKAWKALQAIPFGELRSYKQQAEFIKNPKAVRAVGGANNKNPIAIIIPCHRVIGSNKKLVGYAPGVDKKEWILEHEKKYS